MIIYNDKKYNFLEFFNPENGFLIRSNCVGSSSNPNMRSFPELLDIGIMGQCHISHLNICKNAGIDCYQKARNRTSANMSITDYVKIIKEASGKTFQVALGGAGDPNKHKDFKEILKLTREYNIIPNMTTSGIYLTENEIDLIKKYCGAVAISFYSRLNLLNFAESNPSTINAIERLVTSKCKTNIHFVLSNKTIEEAIVRLEHNLFPEGINAIIFILYKATGFGKTEYVLTNDNPKLQQFLNLINNNIYDFEIGFDTCISPAIIKHCNNIPIESIDVCEAARFSMYIDAELNAYPCSFDCCTNNYRISLKEHSIQEIWESEIFNKFRQRQDLSCKECLMKTQCSGACGLELCNSICSPSHS